MNVYILKAEVILKAQNWIEIKALYNNYVDNQILIDRHH